MKTKLFLLCFGLAVLGGAIAISQIGKPDDGRPDLLDSLYGSKTSMRVHLYGANRDPDTGKSVSGKTIGYDYFKAGSKTPFLSHNELENGGSEDIYFRPDGSKEASREYFPLKVGERYPLLFSRATFAADGVTYTSHDVYKSDGLLERSGRLLSSGWYQQSYFCADGSRALRVRLFDQTKKFLNEQLYDCNSGTLRAEISPGDYQTQFLIKLLRPDGTRLALITRDASSSSGTLFAENGDTTVAEFSRQYFGSMDIRYFNADGQVTQIWSTLFGRTRIYVLDPQTGYKIVSQEWKERPGDKPNEMRLILGTVIEFDKNAQVSRQIEMDSQGRFPEKVYLPLGSRDLSGFSLPPQQSVSGDLESRRSKLIIVQTLDASGKVVKSELGIDGADWENVPQPQPVEPRQIRIAPEALQFPPHQFIPDFDDMGPERVYDYDAGTTPQASLPQNRGFYYAP